VLWRGTAAAWWPILAVAFCIAVLSATLEMLPIRLDDNLTIPVFVGFVTWTFTALFGILLI
jgi:dolichol kinase